MKTPFFAFIFVFLVEINEAYFAQINQILISYEHRLVVLTFVGIEYKY